VQFSDKQKSIGLLLFAEAAGMSLWFMTAAVLPEIAREGALSVERQAVLSSAVQLGFVAGALCVALTGIADRFDPRRVFAISAILASLSNLSLLVLPLGGNEAVVMRFLTGALLAGVYPVGMKIAVGWGTSGRGLLVGSLVGALTFGKSAPYLVSWLGGADWRLALSIVSLFAAIGGCLVLATRLGPTHAQSPSFRPSAIRLAWTNKRIRHAYFGYFGHMWELYVFWAWVAVASAVSYGNHLAPGDAESLGKLTAFLAIALGAPLCVVAGYFADRVGKAEIAITALSLSCVAGLLTALTFGGPVWLTLPLMLLWGAAIVPDSAQFSALVADQAPAELAGSLLTFQTALGFLLTVFTVQATPAAVSLVGWQALFAILALGPLLGAVAMLPLRRGRS
jgi:MFS family permease